MKKWLAEEISVSLFLVYNRLHLGMLLNTG